VTWKPVRSLAAAFARNARPEVRQRGQAYYRQGRVDVQDAGPDFVDAQVRGSRRYLVQLVVREKDVGGHCTCPYFQDRGLCKHIWATILAADEQGYLQDAVAHAHTVDFEDDDDSDPWQSAGGIPDDAEDEIWDPPRRRGDRVAWSRLSWKRALSLIHAPEQRDGWGTGPAVRWPVGQQLLYVLDVERTLATGIPRLDVLTRRPKKNGDWGKAQPLKTRHASELSTVPDALDRQILATLLGAQMDYGYGSYYYGSARFGLSPPLLELLLPMLCRTERFHIRQAQDYEARLDAPCRFDDGPSWEFHLHVARDERKAQYVVRGVLRRGEQELPLAEPPLVLAGGWVFAQGCAARLYDPGTFRWIAALRKCGELRVPLGEADEFLAELVRVPAWPKLALPDEMRFEETTAQPRPHLTVRRARHVLDGDLLSAKLAFDYDGTTVSHDSTEGGIFQADRRRLIRRDPEAERSARCSLLDLGFKTGSDPYDAEADLTVRTRLLPKAVHHLLSEGWRVEIEGKPFRRAGAFSLEVRSGIDWFELHGSMDFGGAAAPMPALLAAAKRGENTVVLDDGSLGMLPEGWLKKWGLLAGIGAPQDDHIRFGRGQAALLDALLAAQPEARCDEVFSRAREELRRFESVEAADPPASFSGLLRGYQREGLGWLHFLQRFGLGGCLADDMGLGKTVQVLALLEAQRRLRGQADLPETEKPAPSLATQWRRRYWNSSGASANSQMRSSAPITASFVTSRARTWHSCSDSAVPLDACSPHLAPS